MRLTGGPFVGRCGEMVVFAEVAWHGVAAHLSSVSPQTSDLQNLRRFDTFPPSQRPKISMEKYWQATILLTGIAIGAGAALVADKLYANWPSRQVPKGTPRPVEDIRNGLEECIGNTPLIRIKCLSEATGCEILGKAEVSLNTTPSIRG